MEEVKMTWEELVMNSNKELGYCLYDENFLPYLYKEIDDDSSILFYKNTGNVRYRLENEKVLQILSLQNIEHQNKCIK